MSRKLLILFGFLLHCYASFSQQTEPSNSVINAGLSSDSVTVVADTLGTDIESPIFYDAKDSIIYDAINDKILLFGSAVVKYDDITLSAGFIEYDFNSSTVSAKGLQDSLGVFQQKPELIQGGEKFNPDSLSFNFQTEKAFISNVVTQNGEFYLISEQTKRVESEKIYLGRTKISTCDDPNPHYHFQVNKAAVVPADSNSSGKIVTGPVFLKFRKIPTPIALPFAWFPDTDKKSKGIIIPSYGNAQSRGYYLQGLGYYLPINDYVDTRLLGDIYTRGSWSIRSITAYRRNYRRSGRLTLSLTKTRSGFQGLDDFSSKTDFKIGWTHSLDPKAIPNFRFSSSVNIGSSTNNRNNYNTSQEEFLTNTFTSNVNLTKSGVNVFGRIPTTFTMNLRHTQNTQTRLVSLTLPQFTMQMNRYFPFKTRKIGKKSAVRKAIEGIGVTNTGSLENKATIHERELRLNNLNSAFGEFDYGYKHQLSASTSIKAGVVSINPSFGLSSNIYAETLKLGFDTEQLEQTTDTLSGLNATYRWNTSVNATTKLFGTFNFRNSKKIKAIRHSLTPSAGFSYRPQTGEKIFGFFDDSGEETSYDPAEIGIFGSAANYSTSGALNLGLINNLEMKVDDGEGGTKKVKLIDRISLNTSRDFARDSLVWSDLRLSAATRLSKNISVNYQSSYSFYDRDSEGTTIDQSLFSNNKGLARLRSMSGGVTANLSSADFGKKEKSVLEDEESDIPDDVRDEINNNRDQYVDFSSSWNLSLTYTFNLRNDFSTFMQDDSLVVAAHGIKASGGFNVTPKLKFTYFTGIDIKAMDVDFNNFEFTQLGLTSSRFDFVYDLHCWNLNVGWVPFGVRKSITVAFNVKASALRNIPIRRNFNYGNGSGLL